MKKMTLLVIAIAFIFTACGGDEEKNTENTDSDVVTEDSSNDSEETADNEVTDDETADDAEEEVVDFPAENNKLSFKINGVDAVIRDNVLTNSSMTEVYYIEGVDELFINYDSYSTDNYSIGFGLYKYMEKNKLGEWKYYAEESGIKEGDLSVTIKNQCDETGPIGMYGMGYLCDSEFDKDDFKVTITEYSGVGGKIAGTFSGTLIHGGNCTDTIEITDGVFEIRRTEDEEN